MSYGVTSAGFVRKPLEQIKEDVAARLRGELGAGLNLTTGSAIGVTYLIFCEELAQLWEVGEAVFSSWDPDAAEGAALDNISAITGTLREDAKKSVVNVIVAVDRAVDVAAGDFVVSVEDNPSVRFVNTTAIVTSSIAMVLFEAEEAGPIVANAGTLTVIETPVSGIIAVENLEAATVGKDIEANVDLRARREAELDAVGSSTVDSIRAKLLKVDRVIDCIVFENDTNQIDAAGRSPKSIHAVIYDDDTNPAYDTKIAQALWDCVAGGIQTHGSTSEVATDGRGKSHTVYFDRATSKPVYLEIDLGIVDDEFSTDGVDQIGEKLVTKGNSLGMGRDVIAEYLKSVVWSVSGVHDITGFRLGFDKNPTGTDNLPINDLEIARFDTSRVDVTTTAVIPS